MTPSWLLLQIWKLLQLQKLPRAVVALCVRPVIARAKRHKVTNVT